MGKRRSSESGAPRTGAAKEAAIAPTAGRMDDTEAVLLAEEFARLLTDEAAAPKGYVLSIAPRQLVVRDLDDVRASIRTGLGAEDLPRARASLSELARLLGV
jgi:hypothetical protein